MTYKRDETSVGPEGGPKSNGGLLTPKKATDADVIKWQFRWITENASELTEKELELCLSFGDQFRRRGSLSERQMKILEEIYKRRT